jgi:hypothetical protein
MNTYLPPSEKKFTQNLKKNFNLDTIPAKNKPNLPKSVRRRMGQNFPFKIGFVLFLAGIEELRGDYFENSIRGVLYLDGIGRYAMNVFKRLR